MVCVSWSDYRDCYRGMKHWMEVWVTVMWLILLLLTESGYVGWIRACNFVFSFRRSIPLFLYYCFLKCICIRGALFEITSLYDCCRCYEDRLWFFKSMCDQVRPFETIRFPFEHFSLWISCVISSETACICLNLCFMKMLK